MLLSMQKKISCMIGEFHEGIVDAGTVADAVLDREFLASVSISRTKKDAFLEVLEEVVRDMRFPSLSGNRAPGEGSERVSSDGVVLHNQKELFSCVHRVRKELLTARELPVYVNCMEPVFQAVRDCCRKEDVRFNGSKVVMKEHASVYFAHIIGALLES